MLIKSRRASAVKSSEITPKSAFMDRRRFVIAAAGVGLASMALPGGARAATFEGVVKGAYATDEELTPFEDVTRYNNFYELGTGKGDPARNAESLKTKPWSVIVGGEVAKPGTYDFADLIKPHMLEERIYRLRCVEAWSMVVPWVGIPLGDVIKRLEPTSKAKYVAFQTLHDPEQLPGQRRSVIDWPYVEGLRLDEAMNPLSILAVGLYGEVMPNQNGAPIRLVVPWKYGFKSIKSIVRMHFVGSMPPTAWNKQAPREYGFYSNVNPGVDHPRWSQRTERRIGEYRRRETLMFNGYEEEVASLYTGMDLAKNY